MSIAAHQVMEGTRRGGPNGRSVATKGSLDSLRLPTIALGFTALTACITGVEAGQTTTGAMEGSTTGAVAGSTTGSSAPSPGSPKIALADQSGTPVVTATYPNQCEIDLDFGDVHIGQTSTVKINVENTGSSTLDLQDISPTLDPEFAVKWGAQPPIPPGTFNQFQVSFETYKVGQVQSVFQIQTDGVNPSCPPRGSVITVQLTGTGVQNGGT